MAFRRNRSTVEVVMKKKKASSSEIPVTFVISISLSYQKIIHNKFGLQWKLKSRVRTL